MRLKLSSLALLVAACGGDRTQAVHPKLVPPASSFDFGKVPVLNVASLNIPFQNVGGASLTVDDVVILFADGGVAPDGGTPFAITQAPSVIASGATDPVTVTFTPPAESAYAAMLQVTTEDTANPVVDVTLTGTGSTAATMTVMPPSLDFGRVNEGTSAAQTVTITAGGTANLILNQIDFTAGTPSVFSFLGSVATPATLDIGMSVPVAVKFHAAVGSMTGADGGIEIDGTDPLNPKVIVPMVAGLNRAPIPVIAPLGNGAPGMTVKLDGSASYDPDGDNPLTYQWTLALAPGSASTTIAQPTAAVTQMTLDPTLPGEYDVLLDVTDAAGAKDVQPAKASIVAVPAQQLLIELFQDNPDTDLDIHFLMTQMSPVGGVPGDCFYANPDPIWAADAGPQLLKDALTGYGPDVTAYDTPMNSTFRVVVGFTNADFATNPATTATLRIYVFGEEKAQLSYVLQQQGDYWIAADIAWPSGTITPL